MKRLFVLAIGIALVSSKSYSAPFYKVECYDSNYKVVSCDDKARATKSKKIARVYKKKTVKTVRTESLAERKARERAMALRELAKQNETLKYELDSLRRANLITAARTSEAPATQAAPVSQAVVPAPMPIASTQIAKNVDQEEASQWSAGITNELSKVLTTGSTGKSTPLLNELDLAVSYTPYKDMTFTAEEDIYWLWSNPDNEVNNGFKGDNPQFYVDYSNIYVSPSKQTTIGGQIKVVPGITQSSRDAGMIAQFTFKVRIATKFNDSKGYLKLEPEINPAINRYSAAGAKNTDCLSNPSACFGTDTEYYEKLTPNTRFALAVKGIVGHKLLDNVTAEASIQFKGAYKYADEVYSGGQLYTITPAAWSNKAVITLPKVIISVSDKFSIAGKLEFSSNFENFKPFTSEEGNSMAAFFALNYSI